MAKFGYETIGTLGYLSIWNIIRGSVFTISEDGTADNIIAYIRLKGTTRLAKCAIYKHSDLTLIGTTEERADIPSETPDWYLFNFAAPKPSLISGTAYILVVWAYVAGGISPNARLYYDAGDVNQGHSDSEIYNNFPSPLNPIHDDFKYSIYCTYTPAGAPPPSVSIGKSGSAFFFNICSMFTNIEKEKKRRRAFVATTS